MGAPKIRVLVGSRVVLGGIRIDDVEVESVRTSGVGGRRDSVWGEADE